MSYEVANAESLLGQFASGQGYSDLIAAVTPKLHALNSLVTHGASEDVPAVVKDLDSLIAGDASADVKTTAKALRELIDGQDLIIITDGTSDGEVSKLNQASTDDPTGEAPGIAGLPGGSQDETFELTADIVKVDKSEHLVYGWASIVKIGDKLVTDSQGDRIEPETLERAAIDYTLHARVAGQMHKAEDDEVEKVGDLIESVVFSPDKTAAMLKSLTGQGIEAEMKMPFCGWWIGFHISSQKVWDRIVSGELRAFSIGGHGKRAAI